MARSRWRRLALAAAPQEHDGDADDDGGRGRRAGHQGVDPAGALADLLHGPVDVLLRAHPVGDGVDGPRQLGAGAVDVRYQRVLVDGLRAGIRVRHYMLRFLAGPRTCPGAVTAAVRDEEIILSGPPRPLHHL